MSHLEHLCDPSFEHEEDNNPFPESGLISIIKKDKNFKSSHETEEEDHRMLRSSVPRQTSESGSNSPRDEDTDDDAGSLLLFQGEDVNTLQLDHKSRVSRLLLPRNDVHISISEAGKSNEGLANASKKYIVYTITLTDLQGNEIQTRRRYSDFEGLRDILTRIFPLVVIPPIPPKNYFSFRVLNGFVGSAPNGNGPASPNGPSNNTGIDSPQTTGPSHSYINSNYLNKSRLIEHRKRLLANFLNNCLLIPQIRKLGFFAKFLDPSSNWSDEVKFINDQLPKSVYQLNPENGLNTDPIYASLPLPLSNHAISLPFLNSLTSKFFALKKNIAGSSSLTATESQLSTQASSTLAETLDSPASTQSCDKTSDAISKSGNRNRIASKSQLDENNKKIVNNYVGLTNDYVDLGAFLNSFSVILADTTQVEYSKEARDNDIKIDFIFDRVGLAFDSSLSTINHLISELETKFSEPLGEVVKYTSVFEATKRFEARKLKQGSLVELEIKEKKKELADCLRAEMEVSKIEKGIQTQSSNKSTTYSLGTSPNPVGSEKTSSKTRFLPSIGSMKKITKYVTDIMDQNPELTRKQRISQLQERICMLEKCQQVMLQDISYITDELSQNAEKFKRNELKSMFKILLNYNRLLISWAKTNIEVWEEARDEIRKLRQ